MKISRLNKRKFYFFVEQFARYERTTVDISVCFMQISQGGMKELRLKYVKK